MAVRIPRYQQQIGAQAGATPTVRGTATPYDPTGAAMAGMGEEMQRIGAQVRREQEIEDEKKRRIKEKQDLEDAKLEAHKVLSDARLSWIIQALPLIPCPFPIPPYINNVSDMIKYQMIPLSSH